MAADALGQHFTQISNSLFRDPRISGLAKAVFGLISTHRDGYGVSVETIARCMKEGRDAIRKALRELEQHGYLVRVQTRDPKTGQMGVAVYRITDMPDGLNISVPAPYPDARFPKSAPLAGKPSTVTPSTVNPTPKNTSHKNTKGQKTNAQKIPPPRSVRSVQVGDARARATAPQAASEEPKGSRSAKSVGVRPSERPQSTEGGGVINCRPCR